MWIRFRQAIEVFRKEGIISLIDAVMKTIWNNFVLRIVCYPVVIKTKGKEVVKTIQGNKMYLKPQVYRLDDIMTELLIKRVHERAATKIIKEQISEGMNVLEIGANIGYYAIIEANIINNTGKVYAIEPEPENFTLLKKNIALNNFNNVDFFQIAISDKDGLSKLYISDRSNWHSLVKNDEGNCKYVDVKTYSLDNFLITLGNPKIDFIRMDVEGFEYKIIDGMTNTLNNNNLKLFIEFHPNLINKIEGQSVKIILSKLESFGYEPSVVIIKTRDKIIRDISMAELLENDHILERIFHVFFEKAKESDKK